MRQRSFASAEYAMKKKRTRREKFLAEMERIVPWSRLIAVIEPMYPKSGRVGRPPIGVAKMLRMYCLQQWYGLADEALEDALYDSQALRDFVGIDLSRESVPDATTLLKFRRLLVDHDLTAKLFEGINADLTENKDKVRDPEMHQTTKGNEWHFGMKAHIGADADSGLAGGAPVPRGQEPVPLQEGSPQGAGQEQGSAVQPLRPGQPRHRQEETTCDGASRHWCALSADKTPRKGQNKAPGPRINTNCR